MTHEARSPFRLCHITIRHSPARLGICIRNLHQKSPARSQKALNGPARKLCPLPRGVTFWAWLEAEPPSAGRRRILSRSPVLSYPCNQMRRTFQKITNPSSTPVMSRRNAVGDCASPSG